MLFTSTRRFWFQRLGSLAVVPYLLLAIFGEALHTHPVLPMAQGEAQSTLQAPSGQSEDATSAQRAHVASQHHRSAAASLECAVCLWLSQTIAQVPDTAPCPRLQGQTGFRPDSAVRLSFSPSLTARPRGPPLH